jgi:hypothetical protein
MTIEPIAESACAGTLLTKHAGRSLGQKRTDEAAAGAY